MPSYMKSKIYYIPTYLRVEKIYYQPAFLRKLFLWYNCYLALNNQIRVDVTLKKHLTFYSYNNLYSNNVQYDGEYID